MKRIILGSAALALLLGGAGQATADLITTYDLNWSGAPFGNSAVATGKITLDVSLIHNPGTTEQDVIPFVHDFSITVSGAGSGNGTFGFGDFTGGGSVDGFFIKISSLLDFSHQLVGQPTPFGPWGSPGPANDFNFFSNGTQSAAPNGTSFFRITTNGGSGDNLSLTSFQPEASATPVPSTLVMASILFGVGGVVWSYRRMKRPAMAL